MTVISLQPNQEPKPEVPLDQQIARVSREHGSFAKLNEQSLSEAEMDVDPEPAAEAEETQVDLRQELTAKIATALNEAALNLDFISLLVSSARPQAGNSSISPMLKSLVPNGSLNATAVTAEAPVVPATAGYGWKVSQFRRSADALAAASERLRSEAQMEKRFWETLLGATFAGEVVDRKLQIKYGYRDSGSNYSDRGVGRVERDETSGYPIFHPSVHNEKKLVQVSVFADQNAENDVTPEPERLLGRATVSYEFDLENLEPFLCSIKQERATLFELELMQQLIHEARWDLGSHKVQLEEGKIICGLFGARVEIELVDEPAVGSDAFNIAQAINYSFHLLLVKQFYHRFERAHNRPTPLSSISEDVTDEPRILKPVLVHVHHGILVSRVMALVEVLLPQAAMTGEESREYGLNDKPNFHIGIGDISIDIAAPLSSAEMVLVKKGEKETRIFDLTELEIWLKWAGSEKPANN